MGRQIRHANWCAHVVSIVMLITATHQLIPAGIAGMSQHPHRMRRSWRLGKVALEHVVALAALELGGPRR
jgi:hypothetical protein